MKATIIITAVLFIAFASLVHAEAPPICGVLKFHSKEGANTKYIGIGFKKVAAVGPGGIWLEMEIKPGNFYVLKPDWGWNCYVPPRG